MYENFVKLSKSNWFVFSRMHQTTIHVTITGHRNTEEKRYASVTVILDDVSATTPTHSHAAVFCSYFFWTFHRADFRHVQLEIFPGSANCHSALAALFKLCQYTTKPPEQILLVMVIINNIYITG